MDEPKSDEQTPKPQADSRPRQQRGPGGGGPGGRPGGDRGGRGRKDEFIPPPPAAKDIKPLPAPTKRLGPDQVEKEWVTITGNKTAGKYTIMTESGKELPCQGISGYPKPEKGQRCKANIAYSGEVAVEAVFKSWT